MPFKNFTQRVGNLVNRARNFYNAKVPVALGNIGRTSHALVKNFNTGRRLVSHINEGIQRDTNIGQNVKQKAAQAAGALESGLARGERASSSVNKFAEHLAKFE